MYLSVDMPRYFGVSVGARMLAPAFFSRSTPTLNALTVARIRTGIHTTDTNIPSINTPYQIPQTPSATLRFHASRQLNKGVLQLPQSTSTRPRRRPAVGSVHDEFRQYPTDANASIARPVHQHSCAWWYAPTFIRLEPSPGLQTTFTASCTATASCILSIAINSSAVPATDRHGCAYSTRAEGSESSRTGQDCHQREVGGRRQISAFGRIYWTYVTGINSALEMEANIGQRRFHTTTEWNHLLGRPSRRSNNMRSQTG